MKEVDDITSPFKSFDCNHCGWCCQRAPCSLAILYGAGQKGKCPYLVMDENLRSQCGLIAQQPDPLKQMAASHLILAGMGCTHRFGPHPVSLLKELLARGLVVNSSQWMWAKAQTLQELQKFAEASDDPESIKMAYKEFADFCSHQEDGTGRG